MYISIDFGTCNTVISYYANNSVNHFYNPFNGNVLIPSTITFLLDDDNDIPNSKNELLLHKHYIIGENSNFTFSKFKRTLGTNHIYEIKHFKFTSQELVTLYFKGLYDIIHLDNPEIIATIPAYFNDKQRNELINSINNANFKLFKLFNEPTCASVYYINTFNTDFNKFIIYDIGGGTLDITVVEYNKELNICEIIDIYGNSELGGIDIDHILINDIKNKYNIHKNINVIAEDIKINLSFLNKVNHFVDDDNNTQIVYTRANFDKLINDIIDKMLKDLYLLIDKWNILSISQIIFVGGPTHIPLIHDKIKKYFKTNEECNLFTNNLHKTIVADGACILFNSIKNKFDFTLLDILPMNIGIKVNNEIINVLNKGTKIPSCIEYEFTTSRDGQDTIDIDIYEDNNNIGNYTITNIPLVKRGEIIIKILFSLNNNGILELNVKNIIKNLDIIQDHKIKIISTTKKIDLLKKLLSLKK